MSWIDNDRQYEGDDPTMEKDKAHRLDQAIGTMLKSLNREGRKPPEHHEYPQVIPLSADVVALVCDKNTGKQGLHLAIHHPGLKDWIIFTVNYSHVYGLSRFFPILSKIEENNYKWNFKLPEEEKEQESGRGMAFVDKQGDLGFGK